jgi:hypothetical protein
MQLGQEAPQNFIYTSRATDMGRGTKTKKMSDLPDWTPGPGTYPAPTDFVKKQAEKLIPSPQTEETQQ